MDVNRIMTVISMALTRNRNHKKRKRAKTHVVLDKDMPDAYALVYNTSIIFFILSHWWRNG